MSRLDDLISLRREIDAEIAYEREAAARGRALQERVRAVTTRASWNARVIAATCHHFGIEQDTLLSGRRHRDVTDARHTAMWLMRDADRTLLEIAAELGMDHTSVMHGVRRVDQSPALRNDAYIIREALTGQKPPRSRRLAVPAVDEEVA